MATCNEWHIENSKKRWYYSTAHWQLGDVMVSDITNPMYFLSIFATVIKLIKRCATNFYINFWLHLMRNPEILSVCFISKCPVCSGSMTTYFDAQHLICRLELSCRLCHHVSIDAVDLLISTNTQRSTRAKFNRTKPCIKKQKVIEMF